MRNKSIKNKKTTIDGLAIMVANGFEGVDKKFNEVKKDINEVKDRLGNVEDRLGNVEDRLGNVEDRLGNVEESLKSTRRDILGIGDRFVSKHEFNEHLIRFNRLEQKVKEKR